MQKIYLLLFILIFSACAKIPQIVRFEAIPASISQGQVTKLKWQVDKTRSLKKVRIPGIDITLYYQGELEVSPQKTQDYELYVSYKKAGKILMNSKTVQIKVEPQKTLATLTGADSILVGDEVTLHWKVNPQSKNVILREFHHHNNEILNTWDNLPSDTSFSVKPLKTSQYQLLAIQDKDTIQLNHQVKVATGFFTGTRKIIAGEEAQLIWQVYPNVKELVLQERENSYTSVIIEQNLPLKGGQRVQPEVSTEYMLALIGHNETRFFHKVEVIEGIFTGSKIIDAGESAMLCWRVNPKAEKVWLEQKIGEKTEIVNPTLALEGNLTVKPQAITEYTLVIQTKEKTTRLPHLVFLQKSGEVATNTNQPRIYQTQSPNSENTDNQTNTDEFLDERTIANEPHLIRNRPAVVYFDYNEAKLKDKYLIILNALITYLKKHPQDIVEINGYSDLKGTTKGCWEISLKRAEIVREYLVKQGIEDYRILTKGQSRTFPKWFEEKNTQHAQENRRVEISIME